ncbi:hypothetical protein NUU61_008796 [Penicillium alfredii]|uniref:Transposase MuDR plant domain-containing protein n=1 Tax=Penicillium alfredii TaxID=1506179 RepID=A0A9W9ELW3_9EURO|nr:uncharacterized protein NUU61_008796 [Penicillium alfredii]KAJ5084217.1 hypothetical protein NUU61_008796 [Penicillium alfredii]
MTEMYSGLHVGQRFPSLEDFKAVIRSISVRQHWELRVTRSNKKSVVIGCRSGVNCFFRVVCRSNKNATYISSLQDSHSCRRGAESPAATPARSEASHVRFLLSEIPKLFDMKTKIRAQDVVDAVKRYHGYDISTRQAQRALTKLQPQSVENQSDQPLDVDVTAADQQSPSSQHESQDDGGPRYREISGHRWLPDGLLPPLIESGNMPQPQPPSNHVSTPPPNPQPVQPPPLVQRTPQMGPSESPALNHDARPMTVAHPRVPYPPAAALPIVDSEHPKGPTYPPRDTAPPVPHMVLTNFKIEFSCTSCGALNQSFFPNQGNVTGDSYMGHHPVPNPSDLARHAGPPPQAGTRNDGNDVGESSGYDVNTPSARDIQNAWAAGDLGVPIGPSHT